jgi:hypothetical protein
LPDSLGQPANERRGSIGADAHAVSTALVLLALRAQLAAREASAG